MLTEFKNSFTAEDLQNKVIFKARTTKPCETLVLMFGYYSAHNLLRIYYSRQSCCSVVSFTVTTLLES